MFGVNPAVPSMQHPSQVTQCPVGKLSESLHQLRPKRWHIGQELLAALAEDPGSIPSI